MVTESSGISWWSAWSKNFTNKQFFRITWSLNVFMFKCDVNQGTNRPVQLQEHSNCWWKVWCRPNNHFDPHNISGTGFSSAPSLTSCLCVLQSKLLHPGRADQPPGHGDHRGSGQSSQQVQSESVCVRTRFCLKLLLWLRVQTWY